MQSIRPLIVLIALLLAGALALGQTAIDLSAGHPVQVTQIGKLAGGGRQSFTVRLPRAMSLEVRVPFAEAPFNGTRLDATINGRRLLPYFAFGGDTRYDAVKGKPGMRPPIAVIEGRWVIPAGWLQAGNNELILGTTGVQKDAALARLGPQPVIRITGVKIAPLDGAQLPAYANTVYYDFNVWAQGYPWGDEPNRLNHDLALLGIINGKGMPDIVPALGVPESALWKVKRGCEDNALGWGMGHQEFYTIWEFAGKPQLWAEFRDVDNDPKTKGWLHDQMIYPNLVPPGTDIVLYKPEQYAAALDPAIRVLAPYTDFYNFKCEQCGPIGQGFGLDGERLKDLGIHGDMWVRNYYAANKLAHDLVKKYDPADGRVQEMNHWGVDIRPIMYDTALKRGQPMSDLVDILMMHFAFLPPADRGADGLSNDALSYDKEYPHAADPPSDNSYPEAAITFNRYRLGRTEADMKLGDPKVDRWGNGQPFDFRAGLRGDEMMYNSENGIWSTGYCGATPYQFLHGFFSYSLLPAGASEPRDLKITRRTSLTETKDVHIRQYGEWVNGAGGTTRLRTVDPLYGDLFGWTGQEYCNFGDYISMVGIKEPHHRRPPNDAFGLVRRTCYAFLTTGPVVPATLNRGSSDQLFVKALMQTFDYQQYIGLYAANFTDKPQALDVTLPLAIPTLTAARVYTDRAWDWQASARLQFVPAGSDFRYRTTVPALGAWLVLIPATPEMLAATYNLPAVPAPVAPAVDASITDNPLTFQWTGIGKFQIEVAKEALFRPQDRVKLADVAGTSYTLDAPLAENWRYFWRVCTVDAQGRCSLWSAPRPFVYRWPEYAVMAFPPQGPTPPAAVQRPDDPGNLAWLGEIWGTGGSMNSPTRAIDGQEFSYWSQGAEEAKDGKPAEWCVIWPQPVTLRAVKIQWHEDLPPLEYALQVSDDGKTWTNLLTQTADIPPTTDLTLPQPATARYFRIHITRMKNAGGDIGIREVMLR